MADVTLSRQQYEAMLSAARDNNQDLVDELQVAIDKNNEITRYVLNVRWQDVDGRVPTPVEIGKGWPAEQSYTIELERPIAREDVDTVLTTQATNPVNVQVTRDPQSSVGWTLIDDYDFYSNAT